MRTRRNPPHDTPLLPLGGMRNSNLFSNHWLEHRLQSEPEWTELRAESDAALARVTEVWRRERGRVQQYGREAPLEKAFIHPLLEKVLGWHFIYQAPLEGGTADYALFFDDATLGAAVQLGADKPEFWSHPAILADAKAWHVNLDRPVRVENRREYPPEQIERYLLRTGLPYAILTNGHLWRLIPRQLAPGKPRFQTYFEINAERLLDAWLGDGIGQRTTAYDEAVRQDFLRFYLFFSPRAFQRLGGRPPLVERALRGSSEYALSVGEDLKARVFEALRFCIEGFLTHAPNSLDPARDLNLCREQSFVLLYRLLFIMYAEDRGLLPYRRNRLYTENRSLARHRNEIADTLNHIDDGREPECPADETAIWADLASLFDLIDHGHARYGVPAYNGGLFDPDRHEFLANKALPDRYLARVIDHLGRAKDPQHPQGGLFRVDYRDLAIQHLGSIYEGLLELRPRFATEPMVVVRERGSGRTPERTIPQRERVPSGWEPTNIRYGPGEVFLETDKGERRASGSYYTPDHIVNYIVENTLKPLCRDIAEKLTADIAAAEEQHGRARGPNREAIAAKLEQLRGDYDDRVLKLRVLDPAMGSGHFLVRACQYLAAEIATNPHSADPGADQLAGDEPVLTYWKRRVVESCIFGVDLNPMAVELAKVALWLETVSKDAPLSFLDHHLRPGNSLVGARVAQLGTLPGAMELQQNVFKQQVEQRLPILLEPLSRIRALPSESMDQIKEKDRLYRKSFQPVCDMFRAVADLWCSTFFATADVAADGSSAEVASAPRGRRGKQAGAARPTGGIAPEQYSEALNALQTDATFRRLARQPWFEKAVATARAADVVAFHWELEFPEVFFDLTGRRAQAGFDAIIGNPPWGRAALLEALKATGHYAPVTEDHAEFFVCLAINLTAGWGRLGLVLPDTILSPAKADIRRHMLTRAKLTACYNIGPDWFTSAIRMSTVLLLAESADEQQDNHEFSTCILPVGLRRACQAGETDLASAIESATRRTSAANCLADSEVAIPLFGDSGALSAIERAFCHALTLSDLCEHARGVELNKAGEAFRCPHCGTWEPPPKREPDGTLRPKECAHCGREYRVNASTRPRILVSDLCPSGSQWRPYIDGDAIKRFAAGPTRYVDTSATGINYKAPDVYRSPKILIRQAGIGVNAVLNLDHAYCPQSVYIYRVKDAYRTQGVDEHVVLSVLCSRLFHLQVFTCFGEIDSSRAFSKLTHTRLARLRVIDPGILQVRPALTDRIRAAVATLTTHGIANHELEDWEIEACWAGILGLTAPDAEAIIRNFAHVHENETLLSLFPGGVAGRENHWLDVWRQAAARSGITL